jgi:hypothetical protein
MFVNRRSRNLISVGVVKVYMRINLAEIHYGGNQAYLYQLRDGACVYNTVHYGQFSYVSDRVNRKWTSILL